MSRSPPSQNINDNTIETNTDGLHRSFHSKYVRRVVMFVILSVMGGIATHNNVRIVTSSTIMFYSQVETKELLSSSSSSSDGLHRNSTHYHHEGGEQHNQDEGTTPTNDTNSTHMEHPVVVNIDVDYLYWNKGQEKFCQLLRNLTIPTSNLSSVSLGDMERSAFPKTIINVTMDCKEHYHSKQNFGQGNWITAIYATRMAAALAGVDYKFQCTDGRDSQSYLLLPWFDQYIEAPPPPPLPPKAKTSNPTTVDVWPYSGTRPTEREACTSTYSQLRIDKMASQIRSDVRSMAHAVVRNHNLSIHDDIDEVALHFRCGDVLGGAQRNDFGMIRFNEYKKWIPNSTQTLSIFTQPFDRRQNRMQDKQKADNCRVVVSALVEYLQRNVTRKATITVRNSINDTHPLTYARMVLANTTITSLSSFGIFPTIASYGQGYFQKGNRGVNPFANFIPEYDDFHNIHKMEADVRGTGQMVGKPIDDLLSWFLLEDSEVV